MRVLDDVRRERQREPPVSAPREIASSLPSGSAPTAATAVRASVVITSRMTLRTLGREDDYFELLAPQHRDAIRELSGVGWLPIDVADAHYAAADALGLTGEAQRDIGRQVAHRLRDSYAGSIVRSLRVIGALGPHAFLSRFPTAWERLVQGGAARVYELGPKEVRIECLRTLIARHPYVREGWAGMIEGSVALVSRSVHVAVLPEHRGQDRCAFRVSWV